MARKTSIYRQREDTSFDAFTHDQRSTNGSSHENTLAGTLLPATPHLPDRAPGAFELFGSRAARHRHPSGRHSCNRPPGVGRTAIVSNEQRQANAPLGSRSAAPAALIT